MRPRGKVYRPPRPAPWPPPPPPPGRRLPGRDHRGRPHQALLLRPGALPQPRPDLRPGELPEEPPRDPGRGRPRQAEDDALLGLLHPQRLRPRLLPGERRPVLRVHPRLPRREGPSREQEVRGGMATETAALTARVKEAALKRGALVCGVAPAPAFDPLAPDGQRPGDPRPGARSVVIVGGAPPRAGDWVSPVAAPLGARGAPR